MREQIQVFDPRQTMSRPNFEIFHYQEPHSSNVEMHHHDFYEIFFFLNGRVEYRVEGRIYHLQPGDLLLINPMELHQLIAEPGDTTYERFVLWIEKEYLERLSTDMVSLTRCFDNTQPGHSNLLRPGHASHANILMQFKEIVRESYGREYGNELYARSALLRLMVELNRLAINTGREMVSYEESSPLISNVLLYIGEHYDKPLSLEMLSQKFYVSKYHLSHEFSRIVGTSIYRYVMLKRLVMARQMLSNGIAPGTVSISCGFSDYSNFYRAFRAQYGISPGVCAVRDIP